MENRTLKIEVILLQIRDLDTRYYLSTKRQESAVTISDLARLTIYICSTNATAIAELPVAVSNWLRYRNGQFWDGWKILKIEVQLHEHNSMLSHECVI